MKKFILIYLWIYSGIYYGAIEAGDADEHVHIKLHMPKTGGGGGRKTLHHHHKRHKKNSSPPPPPPPRYGHAHISSLSAPLELLGGGSGPGLTQNYLTAAGGEPLTTLSQHYLHAHLFKKQRPTSSDSTIVDDGGGGGGGHGHQQLREHQQLMDAEFYTNEDGIMLGSSADVTTGATEGGDFMLNEYLTSKFAAFPQPTTFEAELISPQITGNSELAYHHSGPRIRDAAGQLHGQFGHQQSSSYPQQHYAGTGADVIAGDQELEEDNEILGSLGGRPISTLVGDSEWSVARETDTGDGLSSAMVKAMKNEHLLKHIMQQQQQQELQQQHSGFAFKTEIGNAVATSSANSKLRSSISSKHKYRDDKLHKTRVRNSHPRSPQAGEEDQIMQALHAYEDMDSATAYSDVGQTGAGNGVGLKPLTVDDIWSQLQRTYLNKYTPQAQPNRGHEGEVEGRQDMTSPTTSSKKHKRNSSPTILKSRKPHLHSSRSVATPSFGNEYQEYVPTRHSSLLYADNKHNNEPSYAPSYTPYSSASISYGSSLSSPAIRQQELFQVNGPTATVATQPNHQHKHNYEALGTAASTESLEDEVNISSSYTATDDFDEESHFSGEDITPEESIYASNKPSLSKKRKHRNSYNSAAYGTVPFKNPYQDLYASYSTPTASTIATYKVPVSTYHPNSYSQTSPLSSLSFTSSLKANSSPVASKQPEELAQATGETGAVEAGGESTSYQWREQQHYPSASYQAYQQLSHKRRPQHQPQTQSKQQQQYQPQASNVLRLPKATLASTVAASLSLSPTLAASSAPNDFTTALKSSSPVNQQRYKKRKNRLKSKRNRIVVV